MRGDKAHQYKACLAAILLAGLFAVPVAAQDDLFEELNPRVSSDLRLRYQYLNQDNALENGNALTLRFLGDLEFDLFTKTSVLAEVEGVVALQSNYNDGTGRRAEFPFIPDPEGLELNRLQVITEAIPNSRITLGRQRLALDDWRFVGAFPFRQNSQSIEAVRIETTALGLGIVDAGYFNKVRRPLGEDNEAGVFSGDSFFVNYNLPTFFGRVSVFHYAFELETGATNARQVGASSQTTGARVLGRRDWENVSLVWEGSYAQQSDYSNNPNNFIADYGLLELSLKPYAFTFKVRGEVLGSDNGQAIQTPLASLHRFQGFADKFLRTPDDGVRDYSISGQYDFGSWGPLSDIKFFGRHHWFSADTDGRDYGQELDLSVKATVNKTRFSLEYASYSAETFSTDTKAVFLTTEMSF